jgi:hypothetical protein
MSDLVQFRPNPKPSQLINATARLRNANMMFIISRHRRTSCCAHFSQSSASMMGPRGRPGLWMEAPRLRARDVSNLGPTIAMVVARIANLPRGS